MKTYQVRRKITELQTKRRIYVVVLEQLALETRNQEKNIIFSFKFNNKKRHNTFKYFCAHFLF